MDLTPTPEQEAFRAELRAWLHEHLPWEYGQGFPPRFPGSIVMRERQSFIARILGAPGRQCAHHRCSKTHA